MTELSALAGSEGYAACNDGASVELAAFLAASEAQSEVLVSIGRSRPGDFIVKKRPSRPFFDILRTPGFPGVLRLIVYLSSRKYERPRWAGGWFSRLFFRETIISTAMVTR